MTARSKASAGSAAAQRSRLSDQAYGEIRRLIIECVLRPGASISEPELSQRLRLNKSGVRVALNRLAEEKLITAVPRQGYLVSPLTIKDARNILELRLTLEPRAAYLAAGRVTAQDFSAIRKQFEKGYTPSRPETISAFIAANKAARIIIANASGNERMAQIIAGLVDELERYLRNGLLLLHNRSDEFFRGHRELVAALVSGRAEEAERLCREQLTSSSKMILESLFDRQEVLEQPLAV